MDSELTPDALTPDDFMLIGKEVQNKSGRKLGGRMSEDRAFRDFFGVSAVVVVVLWRLLVDTGLLPDGGTPLHLLWTLYFFKVYPKQGPACSSAGGSKGAIDPKTWRKYIWPFVFRIADLVPVVVSFIFVLHIFCLLFVQKNETHALILF